MVLKRGVLVAESATLGGSAGCVGLGGEPQYYLFTMQTRQAEFLAAVGQDAEGWGAIAGL